MRFFISILILALGCTFAAAKEDQPVQVIVSIKNQSLKVYRGNEEIAQSRVSTGKRGYSTPTGIFSILNKKRRHYSNIYRGAPMPFMQRLTWSGIALHASNSVPSYPASHGCVRLPHGFAKKLFKLTQSGAHVIIAPDEVAPEPVRHQALFQPMGILEGYDNIDSWVGDHVSSTKAKQAANAVKPLRIFITRRTQRQEIIDAQKVLNKLGYNAGPADGILGRGTRDAIRRFEASFGNKPTGLFNREFLVSLYGALGKSLPANGHLFVRRNFRPVFDAPINIKDSAKPLGAHLLTAVGTPENADQLQWMHVSLEDQPNSIFYTETQPQADEEYLDPRVQEVLSRIEIGEEVRVKISRLLTAGSSLTISDNGLSRETGEKGTDFIILTKPGAKKTST